MAKYEKREFRVGEYYLTQRPRSNAWQRTWYDAEKQQTRKVSLDTDDYETAKTRLLDFYMEERMRTAQSLAEEDVGLKEVFKDYLDNHAVKLRSEKTCRILLSYWEEFYGYARVSDLRDVRKQEEFREFLFGKGLAHNSVNRVLEIGRAAIRRAYRRNTITNMPNIITLKVEEDRPKGRPLTDAEIAKLYTHAADHMRLFMILMLGTGARNEAICHLEWSQIDFENGLIHLNPEGRKQTSKRRPTVRMVPFVREQLSQLNDRKGRVLQFRGKGFNTAHQGIEKALLRSKLSGRVTAYSFRHTVARHLRKSGVSPWETAMQLGHKVVGFSMTERYAAWSPDYLENAAKALETLLRNAIPLDAPLVPNGR